MLIKAIPNTSSDGDSTRSPGSVFQGFSWCLPHLFFFASHPFLFVYGTEKRSLASSLQQPVLCYLRLKNCLSPIRSPAGCSSLGTANTNLSVFPPRACPLDLWSFLLPSCLSTSKVANVFLRSGAPK